MYFLQKCFHTKLQIVTIVIGLIAGILAFGSFLHLSIIFWNYEYTLPEELFIFYNSKHYNRTMFIIYTDYKDRMFKMCDKYHNNGTGPESGKFYKGWAFKYDDLEVLDMDGGDDIYHGEYNETDTDLDQGNFSLADKSSSDLQIHKRQVNKFSERRAVRYKRHFSTTSKCNASDKCVRSTFRTHADSLSRYKLTRLPMGIEPIEQFDAVFGGSLYRKRRQDNESKTEAPPPENLTAKYIVTRQDNESETEEPPPKDLKEKCVDKVKLIVYEYNLRLNVGRIVLMGNVADIVTTTVMMLQLMAYLIDIVFITANALLIFGAGLRRSTFILPWMAFWWPFIIVHIFYIWVETFLSSESNHFGLTIAVFCKFFAFLIVILVLGFFIFWLVWCFYYLLFTPEEYMEQLSTISQLVVTGRNIRG